MQTVLVMSQQAGKVTGRPSGVSTNHMILHVKRAKRALPQQRPGQFVVVPRPLLDIAIHQYKTPITLE